MKVAIVGDGPAAAAVEAAVADVDVEARRAAADAIERPDLVVAVGGAGEPTLEAVNEHALKADFPWIAVELGGIGGYPVVDAAVAGFAPGTACYECLSGRVAANVDPDAAPTAAQPAHTARFAGAVAGRAAARALTDEGDDIFGAVREIPYAERRLLPLPDCDCDTGEAPDLTLEAVDRELEESLARAEQALDERVGLVAEVGEIESVPAPYYLARTCDTSGFSDATAAREAAGVAAGWDTAFMKALGEALERYAAGVYRGAVLDARQAAEDGETVPPSAFVCRSEPSGDESIRWIPGRNLHTEGAVRLPAEFVHYPPESGRFRPSITTGLGLGNGGVGAVLAGLYEVIERDAAMLAWYSTFEPMGLDVDDDDVADLRRRAGMADLEVEVLLVTQDVDVPVVAAAVHREEWPRLAFGAAADLDPTAAARSALAEALQNWMELDGMGPDDAAGAAGAIGHYADFPDSVREFLEPATTVPAASVGPAQLPTGRDELGAVLDRIAESDLTAYAASTTTRDLRGIGFEAVRVLVPAAQPLFFGEPYFGERAESVPADLGFEPRPDRDHHPFP